jgi:hypothetical protein
MITIINPIIKVPTLMIILMTRKHLTRSQPPGCTPRLVAQGF